MPEHRRKWTTAVIVALVVLPALYVGGYYATADRFDFGPTAVYIVPWRSKPAGYSDLSTAEKTFDACLERIFWPIHQLDRRIRPGFWNADLSP